MRFHAVPILGSRGRVDSVIIVDTKVGSYVQLTSPEADPVPGEHEVEPQPRNVDQMVEELVLAAMGNTTRAHPSWDAVAKFSDQTAALGWADSALAPGGRVPREDQSDDDREAISNAVALMRSLRRRTSVLEETPINRWAEEQSALEQDLGRLWDQIWILRSRPLSPRPRPKPTSKSRKK